MPLRAGDAAPDFTATTHTGQQIALRDFRGRQAVVVFFYPRDHMPVCTREACSFRDAFAEFATAGATVIGISADSTRSHQAFARQNELPYWLVSDSDGALRRAFSVPKPLGFLPGRVTYVIDKEGIVRHVFNSTFEAHRHVEEALATVRELG